MSDVVVWSKDACFYCQMAKNLLELKEIEFEERNTTLSEETRSEFFETMPDAKTLPQIFIDGEHIGGFTELQKYLKDSESNG